MMAIRVMVNRVIVGVVGAVGFTAIALAGRIRPRWARGVQLAVARMAARLTGVRIAVRGSQAPVDGPPRLYVANHHSPLDIPVALAAVPGARFAAAVELFRIPALGGALRSLEAVPVDRDRRRGVRSQIESLTAAAGRGNLLVFAQGGIVAEAEPILFKSGAFAAAIAAQVPVVPVAIAGTEALLGPGVRLGVRPGTVRVAVGSPIPTAGLEPRGRQQLAATAAAAVETLRASL